MFTCAKILMAIVVSVSIGDRVIVDIIVVSVSIGDRVIVDINDNVGVILDNHSGNDNSFSNDCINNTSDSIYYS
jgi:hypothetical protein